MRASEARRRTLGQIQMSHDEVYRDIQRVSRWGLYSTTFAANQLSKSVRIKLEMDGYRLIESDRTITVAWNE